MNIHPTAIIGPGAALGRDITIGPYAVIENDVRIGDGCVIGPHVTILAHTTLGRQCRVHAGAVLGDLPQDLAFKDVPSYVKIGDGCVIREGVTIHRGTKPDTATVVGDQCYLMALVHLGHNVTLGNQVIIANGVLLAGYVTVCDRAFISGHVTIHQFVRIGRLAMLGGMAGISQDVPPFCTAKPHTVNRILGLNVVGLRRAGISPDERLLVKRAFALLYRAGLNHGEAVVRIRAELGASPHAVELADFVAQSKRGICSLSFTAPDDEEDA